jgi:hypothetical protein
MVFATVMPAKADPPRMVTAFAGLITANAWEDAVLVWDADYLKSGIVGFALGQDLVRRGRLSLGYEVQLAGHFGIQDHVEVNAPLVLRYDRAGHRIAPIGSLAFGIGPSWASEKPQVEIDLDGDTTRTMIYWMGEVGFDLPGDTVEGVLRLHHRSDGYGLFPVDSGSNAVVVGFRRRF